MQNPEQNTSAALTDSPPAGAPPRLPAMQRRLRAETANFDFAMLLNGASPGDADVHLADVYASGAVPLPATLDGPQATPDSPSGALPTGASSPRLHTAPPTTGNLNKELSLGDASVFGHAPASLTVQGATTGQASWHFSGSAARIGLSAVGLLVVIAFAVTRGHIPAGTRGRIASSSVSNKGQNKLVPSAQALPSSEAAVSAVEETVVYEESPPLATPRSPHTGAMRLKLSPALTGPFSYWFVAASAQASTPQALPARDAQGRVSLTIPAAYNHAGAQVRVLDQSLGKVARLPAMDFSRPETVVEPLVGGNILRDAKVADATRAWTLEKSGPSARGALQSRDALEGPLGVTGRVMRLEVSALGTQNWHIQCYQPGLTIQEGKSYQFVFWAKADRPRKLSVSAILDRPDWHTLGLSASVSLTSEWQKYSVPFTARRCVANHGRVSFLLGDALGTVSLAGISLRRGTGGSVSHLRTANSVPELTLADFH